MPSVMKIIFALIKKEFLQIFRNPILWKLVTFLPIAELLLFPFAADLEIKKLNIAVIDNDHSVLSRSMQQSLEGTNYFVLKKGILNQSEAEWAMKKNKIDILIEIPSDCEAAIYRNQKPTVGITTNAINSMKAAVGMAYLQQFFADFLQRSLPKVKQPLQEAPPQIEVFVDRKFNKKMDYKNIFVPGILAVLVSMIGTMLSTLNIVREKELGTIEQVNITPITKSQFFLGKMIPFWIIGMAEFVIGLLIMVYLFGVHIEGSVFTLLLFTSIFLLAMLGLGFMVSIFAENQVQSMFVIIFFFIVFILLSGLFTPLESMPNWMQTVNLVNPIAHFMEILKCVILKGSRLMDLKMYLVGISIFALLTNAVTIISYKKAVKN